MGKGNIENLIKNSDLTPEERIEKARKAGKASAEARRRKKSMRESAELILKMDVVGDVNKENLKKFGIEENEQNYQTAIIVRLVQRALVEGDTSSIRLLAELTGNVNKNFTNDIVSSDINYESNVNIFIPHNNRDKTEDIVIQAQDGPQTDFMKSEADIVIYGGAAGGGKTYALLLEGLRHRNVKGFGAVIFRKNYTQITAQGGLWDASHKIYDNVDCASPRKSPKLHWLFDSGGRLNFAHLDSEDDLNSWQGTEITYLGFDELTHFSKHQFLYMLSRNRSTCGIKPYVRATCNPDSDSWVADFISWWIDQDTGYAIEERSGKIRYMCVVNDTIHQADTREELAEKFNISVNDCKSITFIKSSLEDNKILMKADPSYMANLKAMTELDMERLLKGNWKIKASAGMYFKRIQIPIDNMLSVAPNDFTFVCRAWDLASTDENEKGDADYTSGVLIGRRPNGLFTVLDVINVRIKAGEVGKLIQLTAKVDREKYGSKLLVRIPQDPGACGKIVAQQYIKMLAGYNVKSETVSGSKQNRATPFASQWQNGNIEILVADWNEEYFNQLESFPQSKHDDMVDASSDAFNECVKGEFNIDSLL